MRSQNHFMLWGFIFSAIMESGGLLGVLAEYSQANSQKEWFRNNLFPALYQGQSSSGVCYSLIQTSKNKTDKKRRQI